MILLIPCAGHPERTDLPSLDVFGSVPGELCVNSASFRREATRFCLAYVKHFGPCDACDTILHRAGKYTELLRETGAFGGGISRSMSPTIFSDVSRRGISHATDQLAIVANCCSYVTRLDTDLLKRGAKSISLSMLALFLLNGEIIDNADAAGKLPGALSETALEFLKRQSFDRFEAPGRKELQFFKGCRFSHVELTAAGTRTRGYLWKAGKVISGKPVRDSQGRQSSFRRGLSSFQKQRLEDFADDLEEKVYGFSYRTLADGIRQYLDSLRGATESSYTSLMAAEVVEAMQDGHPLDLALAVNPVSEGSPYRAVFIRGESLVSDQEEVEQVQEQEVYYFTASAESDPSTGDSARHVSLVVEWRDSSPKERLPRLIIRGWADALCFPDPEDEREVLFPWPASLIV